MQPAHDVGQASPTYNRMAYARIVGSLCIDGTIARPSKQPASRVIRAEPRDVAIPSYRQLPHLRLAWLPELHDVFLEANSVGAVSDLIVHGSFGDLTATPFSDVEVTVVVNEGRLNASKGFLASWLSRRLHPLMLRIDPLQHHGAFFLWDDLISHYNEAILPTDSYADAWAINGSILEFQVDAPDPLESRVAFESTLIALEANATHFFRHGITPYAVKRLVSNVLILPAFMLQSHGRYVSKRTAIEHVLASGREAIQEAISFASRVRANWTRPPRLLGVARAAIARTDIPGGRLDRLLVAAYRGTRRAQHDAEQLLLGLPAYCESMREYRDAL